jgi:hypothetical protein
VVGTSKIAKSTAEETQILVGISIWTAVRIEGIFHALLLDEFKVLEYLLDCPRSAPGLSVTNTHITTRHDLESREFLL